MKNHSIPIITTLFILVLATIVATPKPVYAQEISFNKSTLQGTSLFLPTTLQFGPDERLYVARVTGEITIYTVVRNGTNDYEVTDSESIFLVQNIPNHDDDDGSVNGSVNSRQVTGLLVTGTESEPVIYVGSSDPRVGAGEDGINDVNLDTNSGIISRLTWSNGSWDKEDIVRGLPRSEENHANNGMALDTSSNTLYVTSGGSTNAGAPSNNFARATEYALSAAILSVDLDAIDALPVQGSSPHKYRYDIPTLDDPTRGSDGDPDSNDPFGGNDGLNQAKIVPGGPVQIYSSGYRNAYDLVITEAGQLFTVDNGPNGGWGGFPEDESANCTNDYPSGEPGSSGTTSDGRNPVNNLDNLHLVEEGYYAGHPVPVRGNPNGAGLYTYDNDSGVWRTSYSGSNDVRLPADWPPVLQADSQQCDYRNPGESDGALETFPESTNGMAEYTTDNFDGVMTGNLLAAGYDGNLWRIDLGDDPVSNNGSASVSKEKLATNMNKPLDVVAQTADQLFPGTIWIATFGSHDITILEPTDYDGNTTPVCTGADDPNLDEDDDGFSNDDEIDNGNSPCSAADQPPDNDGDFISDLNDDDDDNDGQLDTVDPFAIDDTNGATFTIPTFYPFLNADPGFGFFGLGFTGLMSNLSTDYLALRPDATNAIIAGGTAGLFTLNNITNTNAAGATNTQQYAFQFGVAVDSNTPTFDARMKLIGAFFNSNPSADQTQGIYIGTGDQDNYVKLAVHANNGAGGLQVVHESDGEVLSENVYPFDLTEVTTVDLIITVDPESGAVTPKVKADSGAYVSVGNPLALTGGLLAVVQNSTQAMAFGLIASSGSGPEFNATWGDALVTHEIAEVNVAPAFDPVDEQTVLAESTLSLSITASDVNNDLVAFTLADGPVDMAFTDNQNNTAMISWTPSKAAIGTHTIDINVEDPFGATDQLSFVIIVEDNNLAPQLELSNTQENIAAGSTLSLRITASDPNADALTLALSNNLASMTITDNEDGSWQLEWTTGRNDIGVHTVDITATDPFGASDQISVQITVTDPNMAPKIEVADNQHSVIAESTLPILITASDPNDDLLALTLNDSAIGIALNDNGNGTWNLIWETTRADIGTHEVQVLVEDPFGLSDTASLTIEVTDNNIAPEIKINDVLVDEDNPFELNLVENTKTTASIVVTDANENTVSITSPSLPSYAFLNDNGDGTATLTFLPSFTDAGVSTITLIATDEWGGTKRSEIVVSVEDFNNPPSVSPIGTEDQATITIGDTLSLSVAFTDPDNNDLTLSLKGDSRPEGLTLTDNGDGTGMITWDTSLVEGLSEYQLIVVATDEFGAAVERTISISLANRKIFLPLVR